MQRLEDDWRDNSSVLRVVPVLGLISVVLVAFGLAACSSSSSTSPRSHRAALVATPTDQQTPAPVQTPPAAPVIDPTATPQPVSTPSRLPAATPAGSRITIILLPPPISALRGQRVAFSVRTTAHTACSIAIGYASAPALPPALPNAAGDASWTWIVGRQAPLGTWPITVGCGTGSGKTTISIAA